eukprot:12416565-Alexandrium_andersonii.AAC.1
MQARFLAEQAARDQGREERRARRRQQKAFQAAVGEARGESREERRAKHRGLDALDVAPYLPPLTEGDRVAWLEFIGGLITSSSLSLIHI